MVSEEAPSGCCEVSQPLAPCADATPSKRRPDPVKRQTQLIQNSSHTLAVRQTRLCPSECASQLKSHAQDRLCTASNQNNKIRCDTSDVSTQGLLGKGLKLCCASTSACYTGNSVCKMHHGNRLRMGKDPDLIDQMVSAAVSKRANNNGQEHS